MECKCSFRISVRMKRCIRQLISAKINERLISNVIGVQTEGGCGVVVLLQSSRNRLQSSQQCPKARGYTLTASTAAGGTILAHIVTIVRRMFRQTCILQALKQDKSSRNHYKCSRRKILFYLINFEIIECVASIPLSNYIMCHTGTFDLCSPKSDNTHIYMCLVVLVWCPSLLVDASLPPLPCKITDEPMKPGSEPYS